MQGFTLEKHYSAKQIAEAWGMDRSTVFKMFADEPGVFRLGATTERRRTRRELRIPESVAARVYAERVNGR